MPLEIGEKITDFHAAEITLGAAVGKQWFVFLDPDGSRRILYIQPYLVGLDLSDTLDDVILNVYRDHGVTADVHYWGFGGNTSLLGHGLSETGPEVYLPYPLHDATLTERRLPWTRTPVNQIPYLFHESHGAWMVHACTFAHQVIADYYPHGLVLEDADFYNFEPSETTDSSIRNRLGLRVGRCAIGYVYDRLKRFEGMNSDPPDNTPAARLWTSLLDTMRDLDSYLKEGSGGHHFWLRDFIRTMDPAAWDTALDEILTGSRGSTTFKYVRLPKIVRSESGPWTPSTESLTSTTGNDAALASGSYWKTLIRHFAQAVKRWDRDPRVRDTS